MNSFATTMNSFATAMNSFATTMNNIRQESVFSHMTHTSGIECVFSSENARRCNMADSCVTLVIIYYE